MCAMVMVVAPREAGQPMRFAIEMNRNSSDRPVMISGITSGAVIMPLSSMRPRSRLTRCSATATSAPSAVAKRGADDCDAQAEERRLQQLAVLTAGSHTSAVRIRPRASRGASR